MADEQYIIEVITNEERVAKLTKELEREETEMRKLINALGQHNVGQAQANTQIQQAAANVSKLRGALGEANSALGASGQKVLQLGRLFDDLQYVPQQGLRPIINNVMELAPQLGIAMIAVQALISNWDSLANLFGMGHTKTEAERMEELAKSTERTSAETEKLLKYKEQQKTMDAQREGKTDVAENQAKGVNQAVIDANDQDVVKGLLAVRGDHYERSDRQLQSDRAKLAKRAHDIKFANFDSMTPEEAAGQASAQLPEVEKRIKERREELARKEIADAANDPAKLKLLAGKLGNETDGEKELRNNGKISRDAGPSSFDKFAAGVGGKEKARKFLDAIGAVSPEQQKKDEEDEANWQKFQNDNENWKMRKQLGDIEQPDPDYDKLQQRNEAYKARKAIRQAQEKQQLKEGKDYVHDSGTDVLMRKLFQSQMTLGMDPSKLAEQMQKKLAGNFGEKAAKELVGDAMGDARHGAMQEALERATKENRKSETVGVMEFASKVQSGVGKDNTAEKHLRTALASEKLLSQINATLKAPQKNPPILFK